MIFFKTRAEFKLQNKKNHKFKSQNQCEILNLIKKSAQKIIKF